MTVLRTIWREAAGFAHQLLTYLLVVAAMLVAGLALLVWLAR